MSGQSSGEFAGRNRLRAGILLLSVTALAACQDSAGDDGGGSAGTSLFDPSVFSAFFVDDFGPYEADARALRDNDPKYLVQKFSWTDDRDGKRYSSYSLDNANVEYAHAAGLTGAGQIIAILDAGFRQSHVEFSGKTIYTPPGYAPGVDDHGTGVASIAAGSADSGEMIGVAPGADLQLGALDANSGEFKSMTAATRQAASVGAIVQNNSWGYEVDATRANYNSVFGGSDGTDYINALREFANNGIIVFAASNDVTRTRADLVSALPNFVSGLEASFITVVNAVPGYSNGEISSASLVSSACLEAARWCMAADGTVYAATAGSDSSYSQVTGTSFAAPQVAGAMALLAEAFPSLTPQELRARLLASPTTASFRTPAMWISPPPCAMATTRSSAMASSI
jgi:subtilisin family serine protease